MFDISGVGWPPPPVTAPPEEIIDCLVDDYVSVAEPVRWSEYVPQGMLADLLAAPAATDPEHREFEAPGAHRGLGAGHRLGPCPAGAGDDLLYARR